MASNASPNDILRYDASSGSFLGGTSGTPAGFGTPWGLTFGPDGDLYVSSSDTSNVLRYDGSTGAYLEVFASGSGLSGPSGLTFTPVPEPATLSLLALGFALSLSKGGLAVLRRGSGQVMKRRRS